MKVIYHVDGTAARIEDDGEKLLAKGYKRAYGWWSWDRQSAPTVSTETVEEMVYRLYVDEGYGT